MHWPIWTVVLLAQVLLAAPVHAQSAPEACDEKAAGTPEVRIRDCSALIEARKGSQRDQASAYNYRGIAWSDTGDHDRAIADFNEATKLDQQYAVAYRNRGVAWQRKNDHDRAIADLNEAVKLDPQDALNFYNRAVSLDIKGDHDRAIADYTEAIRIDPKDWQFPNGRCWARASGGRDLPLALADCEEALRLEPGNATILDSRGFVHLRLGRLDQALSDYDAALKLEPKVATSLYGRAMVKQRKGDTAGAAADIAAAKAIQADIADEFGRYGVK